MRRRKKNKSPESPPSPLPPLPGMPPLPGAPLPPLPAAPIPEPLPLEELPTIPAPPQPEVPAVDPLPTAPVSEKPADEYGELWAKRSAKPLPQIYGAIDRIGSGESGSLLDRYSDRFGHSLDRDIIVLRKKEREEANKKGLEIEILNDKEILEHHWDEFYKFYIDTSMRKWGQPYLNRDFFSVIGQTLSSKILLIMVKNKKRYIAGALNFLGGDTIYGRNWGCIEDHKNLHFEVCYYRAIEYAISKKYRKVEAGAQGAHKISRGYQPEKTFSAHWIKDIDFSEAISNYLKDERLYIQDNIEKLNEYIPFKKNKENQ